MPSVSYLIFITASRDDTQTLVSIFNIAGVGRSIYGEYGNNISKDLWIIPKGYKTEPEVTASLLSEPAIHNASVVRLNNPVEQSDLPDVRRLFAEVGWDTHEVSNNDLSLYLNAALQNQYNYYIDFDHIVKASGLVKISIKPIQEHPGYTAEWLQQSIDYEEDSEDKIYTFDDFEVVTESFQEILDLEDDDEPSLPPSFPQ